MADSPSFVPGRIGIVGLGLIGGSFAKAYAAAGHEASRPGRKRFLCRRLRLFIVRGAFLVEEDHMPAA